MIKSQPPESEEKIEQIVEQIKQDYTKVDLDKKTRLALDFSVKLTKEAWETRQRDIDELKAVGYSDEEIIEIVHVTSYFNYINRVVDGLGGELEEWMRKGKR